MKKISILLVLISNILFAQIISISSEERSQLGIISDKEYEMQINKHGAILKSLKDTEKIYLGKDCDAYSRELGKGKWGFYPESTDFKVVFYEGFEFTTAKNNNQWHRQMPDALKECKKPNIKYSIENYELGSPKEVTTILKKLRNYGGIEEYGYSYAEGMKHGIVGFYNYRYMQKESILAIAYSLPVGKFECHACSVKLSFFLFEKKDKKLVYKKSFVNATSQGEWGLVPESNPFDIIDLGNGVHGLYKTTYGIGQGYSEGHTYIYILSNTFGMAFKILSSFGDEGAKEISMDSWDSKFFMSKNDTYSFNDIIIYSKGIKEGKKFSSMNVYKFNGKAYELYNQDSIK